ncbi:MAG: DegT/DnrJ/EryC1/StrS family aminotransferase [Gammaproteobacteria bacterium]|nr:DegT/DnrJ/EryC1/StrS family aminotransferase [Gammaproteobacteria bacterium]
MTLFPCKGFDFTWGDWLFALAGCLSPPKQNLDAHLEHAWHRTGTTQGPAAGALACLTVRSAFDLFLRVQRWPPGDEVIFSALTVPDMPRVAALHGLKPVALDIDPLTTRWDHGQLDRLIGPRTRAMVLAHLFGTRLDIGSAVAVARQHDVAVIEDCAQAYAGTAYRGHPEADLALFSFGPMKTATALGGAIASLRSPTVLAAMRRLRDVDPVQPTTDYWRRLTRYGAFKALAQPRLFGALATAAEKLGIDREQWLHGATRNLPSKSWIAGLRRRPCAALLRLLVRRLAVGDELLEERARRGAVLTGAIGPHVALPTRSATPHGHWMVPVLPCDRVGLVRGLRNAGFDAMSGRFEVVNGNERETPGAARLAKAVYVPFDPSMPERELERLGELVTRFA